MNRVGFFVVTGFVLAYSLRWLWRLTRSFSSWVRISALLLLALSVITQFFLRLFGSISQLEYSTLSLIGSIGFGFFASIVFLGLLVDLSTLARSALRRLQQLVGSAREFDPAKRAFFVRAQNVGIVASSALVAGGGYAQAAMGPSLRTTDIPLENLPTALSGLKIVQITDLHVGGATIGTTYVQSVVDQVNALEPDLIVLTGDVADGIPAELATATAPLSALKAKYGKFYVTGNHEFYWGVEEWVSAMEALGFVHLLNENRILEIAGEKLLLAGVPDIMISQKEPGKFADPIVAAKTDQTVACKILLSHRPDLYTAADQAGYDLMLSGHTHAGQFFPWNLVISLRYKYFHGLKRYQKTWVYVGAGTGYWGPVNRFLVPSEIGVLTLKKA